MSLRSCICWLLAFCSAALYKGDPATLHDRSWKTERISSTKQLVPFTLYSAPAELKARLRETNIERLRAAVR
jgi:hypothetical protein